MVSLHSRGTAMRSTYDSEGTAANIWKRCWASFLICRQLVDQLLDDDVTENGRNDQEFLGIRTTTM